MAVPRIAREDLKTQLEGGQAPIILDVRLKYPFEHSTLTLPGAVRMSADAIRTEGLDRGREIVAYDSDPDEVVSAPVVAELIARGFRARALKGGISEWLAANLPTQPKEPPRETAADSSPKG